MGEQREREQCRGPGQKSEAVLHSAVSLQTNDLHQEKKREERGQIKKWEEQDEGRRKTMNTTLVKSKLLIQDVSNDDS